MGDNSEGNTNLFDDQEKKLEINVDFMRDHDRKVWEKVDTPARFYKSWLTSVGFAYWQRETQGRYRVFSLAVRADLLTKYRIEELFVDGLTLAVKSWQDALVTLLVWAAREQSHNLEILQQSGLLNWITPQDSGSEITSAIQTGRADFSLLGLQEVCRRIQWLLLMFGIGLNAAALKADLYTDAEWDRICEEEARKREAEARERAERMARLEDARKQAAAKREARRRAKEEALARKNALKVASLQEPSQKCPVCGCAVVHMDRHMKRMHASMLLQQQNDRTPSCHADIQHTGTYVVQDGIVVFTNSGTGDNSEDVRKVKAAQKQARTEEHKISHPVPLHRCPICGCIVRRLTRHMKRAHGCAGVDSLPTLAGGHHGGGSSPYHPDYHTDINPPGTYVVQDGIVIFTNSGAGIDPDDRRVMRSGSDSEDTWKGFGVGRADHGRFGSIIGEDWAD